MREFDSGLFKSMTDGIKKIAKNQGDAMGGTLLERQTNSTGCATSQMEEKDEN